MEVTLSWTAPGGDYLQGSAASYEIRTATKVEYLQGQDFQTKGILVPSLPHTQARGPGLLRDLRGGHSLAK